MKFSIITATYNRRSLLENLYESIVAQDSIDIEWLIVDDGGTDDSANLIARLAVDAPFEIRYIQQPNSGKASAVNRGLGFARGDLVVIIDDDDWLLPNVLGRVARDFERIRHSQKIGCLSYLSVDPAGKLWGSQFPSDYLVSDHFQCRMNGHIDGDKCEFVKGEVYRQHGIRFDTSGKRGGIGGDSLLHLAIAENFDTCYINFKVLVKNYLPDGITVNWRRKALENPERTASYYRAHLNPRISLAIRWHYMVAWRAIYCIMKRTPRLESPQPFSNRLLFLAARLPGALLGIHWSRK